jgi:RNA polymerase sigma factor (sigma-70 family)
MAPKNEATTAWLNSCGRHPLLTPAEELHLGAMVRSWQDHPDGPANAPAGIRRRGLKARDRMVTANLRLVAHVVTKRAGYGPPEDRFQVGAIGLMRAAEKFNPERGYKFSTFAYWWIRQSLQPQNDFARYSVHIPDDVGAYLLGWKNGSVSQSQKDAAELWRSPALGIDTPLANSEDGTATLANAIPDINQPTIERYQEQEEAIEALSAMAEFDSEIFALMELRDEGFKGHELGQVVGMTRKAVKARLTDGAAQMRQLPAVIRALGPVPVQVG